MRPRLTDERGVTLIELLIVCLIIGFVMDGIVNLLVSGVRASASTQAMVVAQQNGGLAISRIEYEARCASAYSLAQSGAGINLTMPSECSHASGTISWCVESGVLIRYVAANCAGSGESFVSSVTSPTPFSVVSASGDLPSLRVRLTVNPTAISANVFALSDLITLRNAPAGS
jgi:Tfp pilus assembly protein PilW